MTRPVVVMTTVGGSFDAPELARVLVEQRLAACVNIVERIRSIYRWQGKVEDEVEQLLIIKTVDERLTELRDALFMRHPYEVPEFVVLEMDRVEGPYREWLLEAVR